MNGVVGVAATLLCAGLGWLAGGVAAGGLGRVLDHEEDFGPQLSTWAFIVAATGAAFCSTWYAATAWFVFPVGALLSVVYGLTRQYAHRGRFEPGDLARALVSWRVVALGASILVGLLVLSAAPPRSRFPLLRQQDPDNSGAIGLSLEPTESDNPPASTPSGSATSVRVALFAGDATALGHALAGVLSGTLPEALGGLDLARKAAEGFVSSFSESTGENLSDFIFQWLTRERQGGSPREGRSLPDVVIRFDVGRSALPPSGLASLSALPHRNDRLYVLVGSADRSGEESYNLSLAADRAGETRRALVSHGVLASRIVILVLPELALRVPTSDGVLEPENRRVEVWIR